MLALPVVPMGQICSFGIPIRIVEPSGRDGNVSLVELVVLNHLVAQRSPQTIFELGTFDGRTTINLAANAPHDARVFTIDLPKSQMQGTKLDLDPDDRKYIYKNAPGDRFRHAIEGSKIAQYLGDTANFDFSPWYDRIDFVFVDASHSEPYVENDTEIALKLIGARESGIVIWHDYNAWPGVTTALERYRAGDARLKNLIHVPGTTLAICTPRSSAFSALVKTTVEGEEALAAIYWQRYTDVAVNDYYGEKGRLGTIGARRHFQDFGRAEGRKWGR